MCIPEANVYYDSLTYNLERILDGSGNDFSTSDKPPFLEFDAEALVAKLTEQLQEHVNEPSELERILEESYGEHWENSDSVGPDMKVTYGDEIDLGDLD